MGDGALGACLTCPVFPTLKTSRRDFTGKPILCRRRLRFGLLCSGLLLLPSASLGQARAVLTRDLSLQAAYTYSKAIDQMNMSENGGDVAASSNPYSWRYDLGSSVFDRRDIFVANFIYQIPVLRNSTNRALRTGLGEWELSGDHHCRDRCAHKHRV